MPIMKKVRSISSFQTIIRLFLQILAALTLFVAIGWLIFEPGFEPVLAILGSITVFVSPLFLSHVEKEKGSPPPSADECESVAEIQLGAVGINSAATSYGGDVKDFLDHYLAFFSGRDDELAELDVWLNQDEKRFGLLVAPAGMGKSALVAQWSERLQTNSRAIVVYHPISLRFGTNSKKQTLRSLLLQMSEADRKEAGRGGVRQPINGLDLIDESFNKAELQELCFHLSVDYDNLGEGGKRDKARELIELCQRDGCLDELTAVCRETRPHHNWDAAFPGAAPTRLRYEPPPEGVGEEALSSQLSGNLRQSPPWDKDKPLVVIVDGLDELADQLNQPAIKSVGFLLPNQIGAGVYILAVARGESDDVRRAWRDALVWERAPVQRFSLGTLKEEAVREIVCQSLEISGDTLAPFAEKIYELSEGGDPLIVSLWADWLKSEKEDKGVQVQLLLASLEDCDPGVNGYLRGILDRLQPVSEAAMPLFEVLSLARGSLTTNDLLRLGIKIDPRHLDDLVNLSGRLIIRNAQGYGFSHSRIRQAVQDKYVSEECRNDWLEQFHRYGRCALKQAQNMPEGQQPTVPNYVLKYYAEHLQEDTPPGYEDSLYALIDQAWMNAHSNTFDSGYEGFLADVDRALDTSTKNNIAIQIKGLMCHASITSLSSDLPPHLPALLIRDKMWTPQQAVSHTSRVTDIAQRARTWVTLLTVAESEQVFSQSDNQTLRAGIISSTLRDIAFLWDQNNINEAELFQLQLDISPSLSAQHLDEALPLASKVQRLIWQARLLAELLPLMDKNQTQQIETIKKIIHACSKIDDHYASDDIPFIVPTFTAIAKNLSIKQLSIAFSEVWEEESQAIKEQEQAIAQAKNEPSLDRTSWIRLNREHREREENRTRKKRILNYLAWHIEKHQATAFVELLFDYDSLPQVAEKIARFARRLDHKTAYNIAIRLKEEFVTATQNKREFYIGGYPKGIGIGLIALASVCKRESQKAILKVVTNYIQTHGAEDFPYSEQDLWLFYQVIAGDLTDTAAADLVKQGKFMQRFWQGRESPDLSLYSQEIVAYLGAETLKLLFERCMKYDEGDSSYTRYWYLSGSPYILPIVAEKLPDEELSLIYEIGHSRGEVHGDYGYVRATTQFLNQKNRNVPKEVILDTIRWAFSWGFSDSDLKRAIARFITPSLIPGRSSRTDISASMAKYLPTETVQYVVHNFDKSYYGEAKGTEIFLQFVQHLTDAERVPILQSMQSELFQIKDSGELNKALKALERSVPYFIRGHMQWLSRKVRYEMTNSYLLTSEHLSLEPLFMLIPFIERGFRFSDYAIGVFEAQRSLFEFSARQIGLLRLNKLSHQLTQDWQAKIQRRSVDPLYLADMNSWSGKLLYRIIHLLASSRFIWILYLLCIFIITFFLLLISSIIILLLLPLIVLVVGGQFLLFGIKLGIDWLKHRFRKRKLGSSLNIFEMNASLSDLYGKRSPKIKEDIKEQIQTLNQLPEPREREQAFVDIAHAIENNWRIHYIDIDFYREYALNARDIWSELKPEFASDALSVLTNYHSYDNVSIDSDDFYLRAIMPAVALKGKLLLPDLIDRIENSARQRKALLYACLSYFLEGEECLTVLKKAVTAFPDSEAAISGILTEIAHRTTQDADYATPDLMPHLLRWLSDYPAVSALEKLAPKIAGNDKWLTQGFAIAGKFDDSVHGFILNLISSGLNKKWLKEAIVFVMERDIKVEQEKCMPVLVEHWLGLPSQREIYEVWQEVMEVMKGYSRPRMLTQLTWFSDVIVELAGSEHVVDVVKEMLSVWQWWDVVWQSPPVNSVKPRG